MAISRLPAWAKGSVLRFVFGDGQNREDRMFDPECYELASYFLSDSKDELAKRELSQHIQDAIEDWLAGHTTTEHT